MGVVLAAAAMLHAGGNLVHAGPNVDIAIHLARGVAVAAWGADCQPNGVEDICDIDCAAVTCNLGDPCGGSGDCDGDGEPDECEANSAEQDCDGDGTCNGDEPDPAHADCDGNGTCDGLDPDCNGDGVPDACEADAAEQDCDGNGTCNGDEGNPLKQDCNGDGICNRVDLDSCPVDGSDLACLDCNGNNVPDGCDIADGSSPDCNGNGVPDECDIALLYPSHASEDCNANQVPDECDIDPLDPDGDTFISPDCNTNDIPDECEIDLNSAARGSPFFCDPADPPVGLGACDPDCDHNGVPDACEGGCNSNAVPDECEIPVGSGGLCTVGCDPDCNDNGVPDACEGGCNNNAVPDECEIPVGSPGGLCTVGCDPDCNGNGVPDVCDADCNGNNVPDECDIATGTSRDCNGNAVPDECDIDPAAPDGGVGVSPDCNCNGVPDECDIGCPECPAPTPQTSPDANADGVPDECELDSDGDGVYDHCDDCPGTPEGVIVDAVGCPAIGACCFLDVGYCLDDAAADLCAGIDGILLGEGLTCEGDPDEDGTLGCDDRCPLDPNKIEPGLCGCGQSDELDDDDDGVPNCDDLCPDTSDGQPVDEDGCPPTGACCFRGDWCQPDMLADECMLIGGTHQGPGTSCDDGCVLTCNADFDDDGDVDADDYVVFADCLAGPNTVPAPTLPISPIDCLLAFDFDADNDVDLEDVAAFLLAYGGACGEPPCQADADSDGVCDANDNCPTVANGLLQAADPCVGNQMNTDLDGSGDACDTCTDEDGDGWGNGCNANIGCIFLEDDCDDTAENTSDPDLDNVCDPYDNCPNDVNGLAEADIPGVGNQMDTDADGTGDACDPDDDNDCVVDSADISPWDPTSCEDVDSDSCDDCAVGTDGFGPLCDNDPANDGLDTDGDGLCDAGDPD